MKAAIFCLAFLLLAVIAVAQKECPENEYHETCVPCREMCADINVKQCPRICKITDMCACKRGFLRASEGGSCIPEDQCPSLSE